jgi:ribosomal protein S18 acetylase RimI-like enzyme
LLRLFAELDELHRQQFPELFPATVNRDVRWIEKVLSEDQIGFFVAEVESEAHAIVVGFVRVTDVRTPENAILLSRRFGLIDDLIVTEGHRRSGIASALLRAAETWARDRGISALEVTVWAFNQAAQELYASQDFHPLRHYLRKNLDP